VQGGKDLPRMLTDFSFSEAKTAGFYVRMLPGFTAQGYQWS